MKKQITIFNTTEPGETVERYLEGATCDSIEVFEDGSVNIKKDKLETTFVGLPYKLEILKD